MVRKPSAARPASGRSFVVAIILAMLATVAVMVWTYYSTSDAPRRHGSPAGGSLRM